MKKRLLILLIVALGVGLPIANAQDKAAEPPAPNQATFNTSLSTKVQTLPVYDRREINRKVQNKINKWLKKGEFEKTSAFHLRTNEDSIRSMRIKYEKEVIKSFVDTYNDNINIKEIKLGRYNADNETFLLESNQIGEITFPVPFEYAKIFKYNYRPQSYAEYSKEQKKLEHNLETGYIYTTGEKAPEWIGYINAKWQNGFWGNITYDIVNETMKMTDLNFTYSYLKYETYKKRQRERYGKNKTEYGSFSISLRLKEGEYVGYFLGYNYLEDPTVTTSGIYNNNAWRFGQCISGDCYNGYGTYTYPDGDKYVGEFKDNNWHGQGTYTSQSRDKYVGEFKDGKMHGQGTYTYSNGSKYVGEWKASMEDGLGTLTYADGSKYVGEWKAGKMHGQGTYTYPDGDKYVGEFKDNNWHGQGTYTSQSRDKYVGEFKDGKMHGQGTYTYSNGNKYVGEWKDDKKHGQGTATFADGTVIKGRFKNNEFIGE